MILNDAELVKAMKVCGSVKRNGGNMSEKKERVKRCVFRPDAIFCKPGNLCEKCGWCPATAERRKERILARMGVTV